MTETRGAALLLLALLTVALWPEPRGARLRARWSRWRRRAWRRVTGQHRRLRYPNGIPRTHAPEAR